METGHFDRVGLQVVCTTCGLAKCPVGRDGGIYARYCDWECSGYRQDPQVGSLWPGERGLEFGFPVASVGTEVVWVVYPEEE